MNIYTTLQIGELHTNHCEDYFITAEIGKNKLLCAVMDGCTMGTDSYFAATLTGKLLRFANWIKRVAKDRPVFISDNNGFDWMFICWYFHHFTGSNPFGFSSQNLGSLYKGVVLDTFQNFKHLRRTKHTHNPVDDARGNAEALLTLKKEYDLKIKL